VKRYILLLLFLSLLGGCSAIEAPTKFPEDEVTHETLLGSGDEAIEILAGSYDIQHLSKNEFYHENDIYHFVAYFDGEVTKKDLDNFDSYFRTLFLYLEYPKFSHMPYQDIFMNARIFHDKKQPYEHLSLRVYIDDQKTYRCDYDIEDLVIMSENCWEDVSHTYSSKKRTNERLQKFITTYESGDLAITAEDSFIRDNLLHIKIDSSKEVKGELIEAIKHDIQETLQPALREDILKINPFSIKYKNINLIIKYKKDIVHAETLTMADGWKPVD